MKIKNILLSSLAVSYLFASSMQAVSLDGLYKVRKRLLPNLNLLVLTTKSLDLAGKDIDDMSGLNKFYTLLKAERAITKLNLSQNKIVTIIDALGKWTTLETLELDNNQIKDLPVHREFNILLSLKSLI